MKLDLLTNAGTGAGTEKVWSGGKAMMVWNATVGGGNVKLQILGPDGSTWVDVASSTLSAVGTLNVDLPLGPVRAFVTTSTANYLSLLRVPT